MVNTILAIDDNPEVLLSLGAVLEPEFDLRIASSGEQGMTVAEEVHPDLILLDVMMPGLDGFETCKRLHQQEALKDIPVIFLTSLGAQEDEIRCFETGGVDFISKPFAPVVLRARIQNHIRLKQHADMLKQQAVRDGLTGLYNRTEFDQQLLSKWRICKRLSEPLSMLMIDVDFFKNFNDSYGHQDGDACLRAVANVLDGELLRAEDFCARYGGEEFVCLLPATTQKDAMMIAERIRQGVEALNIPHRSSPVSSWLSVSIGVACEHVFEQETEDNLLKRADIALYNAKSQGRNCSCCDTGD